MADEELHLIGPDEIAYRLELTPAQLKITHTALKAFLDDFGHDEPDVRGPSARCWRSCPTSTRSVRSTSRAGFNALCGSRRLGRRRTDVYSAGLARFRFRWTGISHAVT